MSTPHERPERPRPRPSPTGCTISTTPIRAGPTIPIRSGTNCARNVRWCTPSGSSASICRPAIEAVKQVAYDTEHFSSRRVIVRDVRPRRGAARAADHLRSAAAQAGQAAAAAAVHAGRDEEARARHPRHLQRADRRFHRRRGLRRRARYTKHIPVRAIAHMLGIPREGLRPVHHLDPRDPRTRHQGRRHLDARDPGDDRCTSPATSPGASSTRPTI